jgi:hypothetical protein
LFSAFLIVIGQASQVMPVTDRVTVFVALQAGALKTAERATTVISLFMMLSFQ